MSGTQEIRPAIIRLLRMSFPYETSEILSLKKDEEGKKYPPRPQPHILQMMKADIVKMSSSKCAAINTHPHEARSLRSP
uniref:Uncharacterized protein n=1 Tax=Bracon brevicornis TaxID=1563983 RepID=A0A6V7LP98_9HYME